MKKKVISVLVAWVFVLLSVFLVAVGADAFCVYNHTDREMIVKQVSGGESSRAFYQHIKPNDNKCCNWQTHDCNISGKRDGIVAFDVFFKNHALTDTELPALFPVLIKMVCIDFQIQAGGWLTVEGSNGNYRCVRHDYNQ